MGIAFVIQARMGSTRMPQKVLRPFYGDKSILTLLLEKLSQIEGVQPIVATSLSENNDVIEEFCGKNGVKCFRGDESDVLKRFIDAAEFYGVDKIIRICSDNPFLELDSIQTLVKRSLCSNADYISFNINGTPSIKTHFGFWTEYVTLSALKKVQELTSEQLFHEHVTNYIYANPSLFKIEWIDGPECLKGRSNIRLTIDTPEDFDNARKVYSSLYEKNMYPTIKEVVDYLDENPDTYNTMSQQIRINSK